MCGGDGACPAPELVAERIGMELACRTAPTRRWQVDLRIAASPALERTVGADCVARAQDIAALGEREGGTGNQAEDLGRRRARTDPVVQKFEQIVSRQVPDEEKRRRADFVVDTSRTIPETEAQIDRIMAQLDGRTGTAFAEHWA